jgi:hypothetical protein
MATRKTPEGYVLASVLDYLAAKRIFAMRMNSGAIQDKRGIPVRMHEPGTADVLAIESGPEFENQMVYWIECKAPNGRQSLLQKEFEARVRAEGHSYILAFSIDDLRNAGL